MFKKVSVFTRNSIYGNLKRFQSQYHTTYRSTPSLASFGCSKDDNNNNNFSLIKLNFKININRFYSTLNGTTSNSNTTTTNDINLSEINISNYLAEIKKLEILSQIPKPIEEFKEELLKCDPKKLNNNQRLLSSSFLWKYLGITNSSPNTLGERELNKIWSFLDVDTKSIDNKQEKDAIEIQQLIICLHSRYLIDRVIPLMNEIINNRDIDTLSEKMIIQCFLISPHLSRWEDMVKYGKRISPQVFDQLNAEPYYSHEFFPYKKIYELLNIQNSDNNNKNEDNNGNIKPWTQYNIHSLGFKNNKIISENISEETFKTAEKNYYQEMDLLKSKIMDQDGYIIANLGEIKYCLMFGGAVKLYLQMGGPPLVCGGILKDNSIQLYGSSHFEDEFNNSVEIRSEYNLDIVKNNSSNIDNAISLIGNHKQIVSNLNTSNGNNEKYIYTMDIKINLLKD
ncbi:hypothetical protein ACTA71_008634 [Dictyostelium dimigraforme]